MHVAPVPCSILHESRYAVQRNTTTRLTPITLAILRSNQLPITIKTRWLAI
jgi:hypothetical protein